MAPKKTQSAPNKSAENLMKALKRNRSVDTVCMKKKALTSSQTSSPKSVKKKAISTNLQNELNKKRKRCEQSQPTKKEGLKLLKRGAVTMHRIVKRKIRGIKDTVSFNAKGEPFGPVAAEMQSYIGVLARTKAPISYKSWKIVPEETRKKIWKCVKVINCTLV